MVTLFICYAPAHAHFAQSLRYHLRKQDEFTVFAFPLTSAPGSVAETRIALAGEVAVVLVVDEDESGRDAALTATFHRQLGAAARLVRIVISNRVTQTVLTEDRIFVPRDSAMSASRACARELKRQLTGKEQLLCDGLPIDYPFAYEKDIIDEYIRDGGLATPERVAQGCPLQWPDVEKEPADVPNPLSQEQIGLYRDEDARVAVDTRTKYRGAIQKLTFPEAGPRRTLKYRLSANNVLRVGILVSGGIAPGINAVIDGLVSRHFEYQKAERERQRDRDYAVEIYGYTEGFRALLEDRDDYSVLSTPEGLRNVERAAELGGSLLGTSRAEHLLDGTAQEQHEHLRRIVERLWSSGVRILYVIGGDGSMRAAHALYTTGVELGKRITIVGIPKTMDNDILWVWQSFGFMSAVERARDAVLNLHTEVHSNPRLCVIQLFGSDSGFVASHAAFSAVCDLVLIPEVPFEMKSVSAYLLRRLGSRYRRERGDQRNPYGLIVMAETAIPQDALEYIDEPKVDLSSPEKSAIHAFIRRGRRVRGQTPDELRTAGLKIVSRVLEKNIRERLEPRGYWEKFRVFTHEPRHLIRSIPPSVSDVVFGERLGTLAVDNAMAGYTDFMISQWLTEFVLVPLPLVVLGRKRVPQNGIFWKSVLAKTGQPPVLTQTAADRADVFLCHNSKDKPIVREVANQLAKRGLAVWLDEWELQPGALWQQVLQDEISHVPAAAIFIGEAGLGPWQQLELHALMSEFVQRRCRIIPVLLSNAPADIRIPAFLRQFMWIDFRTEPEPILRLAAALAEQKSGAAAV